MSRCEFDNLILVAGFNDHGFALPPAVGRVISDLFLDGVGPLDIDAFRLSRFSEGQSRQANWRDVSSIRWNASRGDKTGRRYATTSTSMCCRTSKWRRVARTQRAAL
jgi:hypothetical protein